MAELPIRQFLGSDVEMGHEREDSDAVMDADDVGSDSPKSSNHGGPRQGSGRPTKGRKRSKTSSATQVRVFQAQIDAALQENQKLLELVKPRQGHYNSYDENCLVLTIILNLHNNKLKEQLENPKLKINKNDLIYAASNLLSKSSTTVRSIYNQFLNDNTVQIPNPRDEESYSHKTDLTADDLLLIAELIKENNSIGEGCTNRKLKA